ncbi:hypothetical protein OK18_11180 [Chryseobacterium gallinarum]|uniref:Uncharacterized protein n=1 Tax=Chryseobacterium gallinarum TaxID=1324352 RepID=A0A0G3M3B7_CHRGL|nr:hypothetical protein OK18_11180 [Chryseobacterium gallinarum]
MLEFACFLRRKDFLKDKIECLLFLSDLQICRRCEKNLLNPPDLRDPYLSFKINFTLYVFQSHANKKSSRYDWILLLFFQV